MPGVRVIGRHVIEPIQQGSRVTLSIQFEGLFARIADRVFRKLNERYVGMEANGLKQKDLVGSVFETASIASEVLSGKREITKEHIRKLSRKFHVSPAVFLG